MGNFLCKIDKSRKCLCDAYYPKHKYLQPIYVQSVGMIGLVGSQLLVKEAIKETVKHNFHYLTSLSALVGTQFWWIFISGKSLHDTLPRIQYAKAENELTPTYTIVTTVLSGVAAYLYLRRYPISTWSEKNCTFGWCVLGSFAMNILNSTCFTQQTLKLFNSLLEVEKNAGVSQDLVGYVEDGNASLDNNEDYKKLKKRFCLMHTLIATTNIVSFGCSVAQLYLLCSKNNFSF